METKLQEWTENLALLETLNKTLVLSVLMRSTAMPFTAVQVPVDKISEYLEKGYIYASRQTVQVKQDWQTKDVPEELVQQYLSMGWSLKL